MIETFFSTFISSTIRFLFLLAPFFVVTMFLALTRGRRKPPSIACQKPVFRKEVNVSAVSEQGRFSGLVHQDNSSR